MSGSTSVALGQAPTSPTDDLSQFQAGPMNVAAAMADGHTAQQITDYLVARPLRAPIGATGKPYNVAGALAAGYTPQAVAGHLASITGDATPNVSSNDPGTQVRTALGAGYSPEEITGHLQGSGTDLGNKVQTALGAGYTPADIVSHLAADKSGADRPARKAFDFAGALGAGYNPQQITDYLTQNPDHSPTYDVAGALKAGWSPAEIVDFNNPAVRGSSSQGTPILAPVARGIAQAQSGVANLLDDIGATGWGHDVRSRINEQDLAAPTAGGDLVNNLKAGHYGSALLDVPSAALEGALPAAAALGASAAAPVVGIGGTAAALAAGAGVGAASGGDAIARARAGADGNAAPSAGDLAIGLGAGAGAGALSAVGDGLSGVLGTAGARGIIARFLGSFPGRQAQRVAADAAMPQLQSLASTAGTNTGAQLASGADSTASALTGLATRAGFSVPDALQALPPVTTAGKTAALADRWNALDAAGQQQAIDTAAAGQALKSAQDQAPSLSPSDAARSVIADSAGQVSSLASKLQQTGFIDGDGKGVILNALAAARSPDRGLTADHLGAVDGLQLDPATNGALQDTLRRMDLLSRVDDGGAGPFEAVGKAAGGPLAGIALGGAFGGHVGAELGAVLGSVLRPVAGVRLGQLGSAVDDRLGLAPDPQLVQDSNTAAPMLRAAGVAIPDTSGQMASAIDAGRNILDQQRNLIAAHQEAQGIDRQFNQDQADQWSATLEDAYSANSAADAIEAARKDMEADLARRQAQADAAQHSDAIAMNRQFDQGQAADWTATLRDAYGMNAQADQIEAARQAMTTDLARRANLQERAADQVSGMSYRSPAARDARAAGLTGFAATQVDGSPSSIFAASGGQLGSPVDGPTSMSGFTAGGAAPGQGGSPGLAAPQRQDATAGGFQTAPQGPVSGSMPAPSPAAPGGAMGRSGVVPGAPVAPTGGPITDPAMRSAMSKVAAQGYAAQVQGGVAGASGPAVSDPVATAQARATVASLLQASRRPGVDLSVLPPQAQAQAAPLADAVWAHGRNLEDALVASGQAKPVNMQAEWNQSLDTLSARGMLPADLAASLKGHSGRVVWPLFNLVRNETLARYGLDRTVGGGA